MTTSEHADYTPTTEDVRQNYIERRVRYGAVESDEQAGAEFDRWAALASTPSPAQDVREVAHVECDCVPDLGPSHCHKCGDEAGHIVPWANAFHGEVPSPAQLTEHICFSGCRCGGQGVSPAQPTEANEREKNIEARHVIQQMIEDNEQAPEVFSAQIVMVMRNLGYRLAPSPVQGAIPGCCDNCGAPQTRVTTPGGFRSCDNCFGGKR